ncbi:heme-dependent oxidative N-demethylase subunit alpha family protein [Deinococcus sp. YIM 77859]|uniref:heme-dependent oxidative N-demethylase subunit alpha family protein n=1 Tax=Deinococcus sp. YIM 77859 TaxID=1540221 RepID=UPI001E58F17F|nr:heme-dependent oxidative N-demethylase subunit alpha family protein [Deinococcus sp. YIM 77859]
MLFQPPACYRPFLSGRYTVSAGLYRLGSQRIPWLEVPQVETHTFALDGDYPRFVASKVGAHTRAPYEYMGEAALTPDLREAALTFIARTLAAESGGVMTWDGRTFRNLLLGWAADLEPRWGSVERLERFPAPLASLVAEVLPVHALDFLGLNAPEDLALVARDARTARDWLAAIHVLSPQHWDPREKLGRDFVAVHAPVAGSGPLNATAPRLIDAVISRGPFVRFAWGLSMGDRLDHHPAAPPDADRAEATRFDPDRAFLRVERQTLTGFPDAQGALFTIRPYTYALREAVALPEQAHALAAALRSMTPEQVTYKGLARLLPELLAWLDEGSGKG